MHELRCFTIAFFLAIPLLPNHFHGMENGFGIGSEPFAMMTFAILIVTALVSVMAFQRPDLKARLIFDPRAIFVEKQWDRMFTSGLIHADWSHFIFNAFSFYSFAQVIEIIYGWKSLLLIYCASIIGGSVLSLFIHRNHDYRALGASGGVCGVIFASIFLLPGSSITLFLFPIGIPAVAYAVLFLVVSFISHRRQSDNTGHDAHLGGAIVGLLTATALFPKLVFAAPITFAVVLTTSLTILLLLIFDPLHLLFRGERTDLLDCDNSRFYVENRVRNKKVEELDELLDQVSHDGLESLSNAKRKKLEQLSKEVYGSRQRDSLRE